MWYLQHLLYYIYLRCSKESLNKQKITLNSFIFLFVVLGTILNFFLAWALAVVKIKIKCIVRCSVRYCSPCKWKTLPFFLQDLQFPSSRDFLWGTANSAAKEACCFHWCFVSEKLVDSDTHVQRIGVLCLLEEKPPSYASTSAIRRFIYFN